MAQTSLIDRLHAMQLDSRLKEKVYVHTNKTSYFPDDTIWFKAYVGDSINYPSVRTRILRVRLFDKDGMTLFSRNVRIKDGAGNGEIELGNAIAPGDYYLQARTNYMRNFGEDYHYLQKITVHGQKIRMPSSTTLNYDIQLLPEGGNLIEDVDNVLGIKALINGRGIDFKGSIIDQDGKTITEFQSEHNGLGKCGLIYRKGQNYRAQVQVQDTVLNIDVPKALAKGVALQVDASDEENLKVYLKTNETTFYDQVYSNYRLLYRQDRQLFDLVHVARLDSLTGLIETKKNLFLDGVHTVTLFADDKPIAERKFYLETNRKEALVSLNQLKIESDSIEYKLDLKGRKKGLLADLSVSVLPESSEALDQKNTIRSAFLLRPFVKGHIENPAYYFDANNKKRKEHLDLLLLTQGWTHYSLDELIKKINPDEKYRFKEGFELKGSLKEETKYKNLVLIPDDLRVVDKIRLNGQSDFVFQNLRVFKGDTVRVAYQNWLGKIIKPLDITYDTIEKKSAHRPVIPNRARIADPGTKVVDLTAKPKPDGQNTGNNNGQPENTDETINLEEVIVSERKRSEQYIQRRKIIEKYRPLVRDIGKYYDLPIPELANKHNISLIDFLGQQGFGLRTSDDSRNYLQGTAGSLGVLFLNGEFVQQQLLPSIAQLQIKDIANIMVHSIVVIRNGRRVKLSFFQVFTSGKTTGFFDRFVITNGYDRAKKYYAPQYDFDQERPLTFSEIDWKPRLKTDKNGTVFFKIPRNENFKNYLFSIQGFSDRGHLISEILIE